MGETAESLQLEAKMKLRLVVILRLSIDLDDSGNSMRRESLLYPEKAGKFQEGDRLFLLGRNIDLAGFQNM